MRTLFLLLTVTLTLTVFGCNKSKPVTESKDATTTSNATQTDSKGIPEYFKEQMRKKYNIDCLDFSSKQNTGFLEIEVHEIHNSKCGGDPDFSPLVGTYRYYPENNKIEEYDAVNDSWPTEHNGSSNPTPQPKTNNNITSIEDFMKWSSGKWQRPDEIVKDCFYVWTFLPDECDGCESGRLRFQKIQSNIIVVTEILYTAVCQLKNGEIKLVHDKNKINGGYLCNAPYQVQHISRINDDEMKIDESVYKRIK